MPRKPKSTSSAPPMASAPARMTLDEMGTAFANAAVLLERLGAAGVLVATEKPTRKPRQPRKPTSDGEAGR